MKSLDAELDTTEKLIARQIHRFKLRKLLSMSFWIQKAKEKGFYLLSKLSIQLERVRPSIKARSIAEVVPLVLNKKGRRLIFVAISFIMLLFFYNDFSGLKGEDISLVRGGLAFENDLAIIEASTFYEKGEFLSSAKILIGAQKIGFDLDRETLLIKILQTSLLEIGYTEIVTSGVWGSETQGALLLALQKDQCSLRELVDRKLDYGGIRTHSASPTLYTDLGLNRNMKFFERILNCS